MPALAPRPAAAPAPARPAGPPVRQNQNDSGGPASARPAPRPAPPARRKPAGPRKDSEHDILFQKYFKSVNPQRTYASQVKKAGNGNQYVVITEGKRDGATGEVRKTRVFVYSEDFIAFFGMLQDTAHFLRDNPVPEAVRQKRHQFWARNGEPSKTSPQAAQPPAAPRRIPGPAPGPASDRATKPVEARAQAAPKSPPSSPPKALAP